MKTINLKGKEYSPVATRVEQFHKDYPDGTITTDCTFDEGHVIFKATVSFSERTFNGHAFGKVGQEKAFEKLETTAVGRALAFAGYLAGGEIASYDEVKDFYETEDTPNLTVEDAIHKLKVTTTLTNLRTVYTSLPEELRNDPEVIAFKDELKKELSK